MACVSREEDGSVCSGGHAGALLGTLFNSAPHSAANHRPLRLCSRDASLGLHQALQAPQAQVQQVTNRCSGRANPGCSGAPAVMSNQELNGQGLRALLT